MVSTQAWKKASPTPHPLYSTGKAASRTFEVESSLLAGSLSPTLQPQTPLPESFTTAKNTQWPTGATVVALQLEHCHLV